MILFWSRQGEPIADTLEWARLYEDPAHRFVAIDWEGDRRVSTIWEGIDRGHNLHPTADTVLPFSTMTFEGQDSVEEFLWHSEAEALAGHDDWCRQFLGRPARPEDGWRERSIETYRRSAPPFPVLAVADGEVVAVGDGTVHIRGDDGAMHSFFHVAHIRVQLGDRVTGGDTIGQVQPPDLS